MDTLTDEKQSQLSMQPPRGTRDILPGETELWQKLEGLARQTLMAAGYKEIRFPVFEHTELFKRGVGETTDIVGKEMYTFNDKSDRSLTLRPEGTASAVRAFLNSGLGRQSPPIKLFYMGPFFRYERMQTGRYRQFHQLGLEAFGSAGPLIDAEVIVVAVEFLKQAGLSEFEVQVNSIGCPACRPAYRELLKQSLKEKLPNLCEDCRDRFERNPLRMLDCKVKADQEQYKDVPAALDHLCTDCESHWQGLLGLLKQFEIPIIINKRLVRGLDYYTRTVFEIVSHDKRLGAQSTVAAGGRYDNLIETLGGQPTAAVGWGLGLERLILLLDNQETAKVDVFVVSTKAEASLEIATRLRQAGISADLDYPATGFESRSFTKQLQQANKQGCPFVVIAGEDELAAKDVTLKDMRSGSQIRLPLSDLPSKIREQLT